MRAAAVASHILLTLTISFAWPSFAGAAGTPALEGGFRYTNVVVDEKPWSIHIAQIERGRRDYEFCTTLGKGDFIGMGIVSEQVGSIPKERGTPIAAINGDFYEKKEKEEGRPRDLQIRFGEVVSCPAGHDCFWIDPAGAPHITNVYSRFRVIWANGATNRLGLNQLREDDSAVLYTAVYGPATRTSGGLDLVLERAANSSWLPLRVGKTYFGRVREVHQGGNAPLSPDTLVLSLGPSLVAQLPSVHPRTTLQIATETVPDLGGVDVAIGGGPDLVEESKPVHWSGVLKFRHPRTAVGWNKNYIFMVEVDGRQANLSIGMTFTELADYMAQIGCEQAMNLDGGGSATMWAFGMVKNSPSEGDERPAPNALVLLKKPSPNP